MILCRYNQTNMVKNLIFIIAIVAIACLCLTGIFLVIPGLRERLPVADATRTSTPPLPETDITAAPTPLEWAQINASLHAFEDASLPVNDQRRVKQSLAGGIELPLFLEPVKEWIVGEHAAFWVINRDRDEIFTVGADLVAQNAHASLWVQTGLDYEEKDALGLIEAFEESIHPNTRQFFGSEFTPGVDGDVRIHILWAGDLGEGLAGYYAPSNSLHPLVFPYSNAHEMIMLNADVVSLGSRYALSVLAHEFQHMIHAGNDPNEESWLNEGASQLAERLNGLAANGLDLLYARQADIPLLDWPGDTETSRPHYGQAYLFMEYLLGRFGENATRMVITSPENGLQSVDEVLKTLQAGHPPGAVNLDADRLFADWAVTNWINAPEVEKSRYAYPPELSVPPFAATETVERCPSLLTGRTVNQYGIDYIDIRCSGEARLTFTGNPLAEAFPTDAHSGSMVFSTRRGDQSQVTLTRAFNLEQAAAPLELSFWTWYELEKDYDYAYLEASLDGERWTILQPEGCTFTNPVGGNLGCGFTGSSGGWVESRVDLSAYAGKTIYVRFDALTDAVVTGDGFLVDDIEIKDISYHEDFEHGDGGWNAQGFVRSGRWLPQPYLLSLVHFQGGIPVLVDTVRLQVSTQQAWQLAPPSSDKGEHWMLIISGANRFSRKPAEYSLTLE